MSGIRSSSTLAISNNKYIQGANPYLSKTTNIISNNQQSNIQITALPSLPDPQISSENLCNIFDEIVTVFLLLDDSVVG